MRLTEDEAMRLQDRFTEWLEAHLGQDVIIRSGADGLFSVEVLGDVRHLAPAVGLDLSGQSLNPVMERMYRSQPGWHPKEDCPDD